MNNKRNHLVRQSTRGSPAPWLQRGVSRPWLMMRNVTLTFSIISSYPTQILLLWKERSLNLPLNQIFFFKDSFLSASILTFQIVGEVRYVKTCQVRSCEEQVALFGGSAAGRHLGNFHCLANPPTALAALFKITALHCVRSLFPPVCTVQNQSALRSPCFLWFLLFGTSVGPGQDYFALVKIKVQHCAHYGSPVCPVSYWVISISHAPLPSMCSGCFGSKLAHSFKITLCFLKCI